MATMNDLFVRGEPFNGETGEKTGAQLEDLVARAYPAASSQLVDDSTLQVYSDATTTDDDGNAINRVRVKAGGIGTNHLSAAAIASLFYGGPLLSALVTEALANVNGSWAVSPTDVDSGLDESALTDWGEPTLTSYPSSVIYYWDLGAVYRGTIVMVCSGKSTVSGACLWGARFGYNTIAPFQTTGVDAVPQYENHLRINSSSYIQQSSVLPFIGRYVGMCFTHNVNATATAYFKLHRFNVYGTAV